MDVDTLMVMDSWGFDVMLKKLLMKDLSRWEYSIEEYGEYIMAVRMEVFEKWNKKLAERLKCRDTEVQPVRN